MSVRRWMSVATLLLPLGTAASSLHADDIAAPALKVGDTWTYKSTHDARNGWRQVDEQLTILRAGPSMLEVAARIAGSDRPPTQFLAGPDWSRTRDLQGHDTVVARPVSFPLTKGKSWTVEFTQEHPDRIHDRQSFTNTYRVGDWEDVTVPAGTFHAIKIEADGTWTADLAPSSQVVNGTRTDAQGNVSVAQTNRVEKKTVGGRLYKVYWYVPEVKRWVKAEEDIYDTNGVRSASDKFELLSDKVAP